MKTPKDRQSFLGPIDTGTLDWLTQGVEFTTTHESSLDNRNQATSVHEEQKGELQDVYLRLDDVKKKTKHLV